MVCGGMPDFGTAVPLSAAVLLCGHLKFKCSLNYGQRVVGKGNEMEEGNMCANPHTGQHGGLHAANSPHYPILQIGSKLLEWKWGFFVC